MRCWVCSPVKEVFNAANGLPMSDHPVEKMGGGAQACGRAVGLIAERPAVAGEEGQQLSGEVKAPVEELPVVARALLDLPGKGEEGVTMVGQDGVPRRRGDLRELLQRRI